MDQLNYAEQLGFNEQELASRRAYFQVTDEDLARLASLRPFAHKYNDPIVEDFYALLLGHPESRLVFRDAGSVQRAKQAQKRYFLELFDGRCDLAYVENRLRVGATHERMGVAPRWYLGAYAHFLRLIADRLVEELSEPAERWASFRSVEKIVFFDMALAIEMYHHAGLQALARHQEAMRELSTPVIRIYPRLLLLPLIGTVDTERAVQVMQQVLTSVVQEKAKVVIVDIAGVPVVDTRVADHLLQTTAAVRLLGAQTILTGISPQVAQTIVQLGVHITGMHTRAGLAEGLELGLEMVGKAILDKRQ